MSTVLTSYLSFHETIRLPNRKTEIWEVRSGREQNLLGEIRWHGPWRRYTYQPSGPQVLDASCMTEIINFISKQMELRK